jgi:hypothetical protein
LAYKRGGGEPRRLRPKELRFRASLGCDRAAAADVRVAVEPRNACPAPSQSTKIFQYVRWKNGAARGIRTPDPVITNDVLYRLSYCGFLNKISALCSLAATRFEQALDGLPARPDRELAE